MHKDLSSGSVTMGGNDCGPAYSSGAIGPARRRSTASAADRARPAKIDSYARDADLCADARSLSADAMPAQAQSHLSECNCLAVRQAARYVTQFYDRHLSGAGLRTSQYGILVHLKRNGAMTINALAAELVMDRTTLGRNILPLERDGLITITPGRSDRRMKELRLTTAGECRLDAARPLWLEAQRRFEVGFGEKQAAEMRGLLRALVNSELISAEDG
jgi:DNA-binding MarR family transcriptional regulator